MDVGITASQAANRALADIIDRVYQGVVDRKDEIRDKTKLKFKKGFETYIDQTKVRCSQVRTLTCRSESVDVRRVHVSLNFEISDKMFSENALIDRILSGGKVVITGIAGCGKSMTMRSVYLTMLERATSIPIFVELRHVAESKTELTVFLCQVLGSFTGGFSSAALIAGLRSGQISLLLDGFDEIPLQMKEDIQEQIAELVSLCPTANILVSGRPDDRYDAWSGFAVAKVSHLDKDQVISLIRKAIFDDSSKASFEQSVRDSLFDSHKNLLSNPLLCSMMLITFDEFSEIPSKMHIFYNKAFEVLYRKHDSLKQKYKREFSSDIKEDDFYKFFETLCYISYVNGKYSFDGDEVYGYADDALDYEGMLEASNNVINDLVSNVCVLLREGDHVNFIHRSFQEYFSARFLTNRNHERLPDLIEAMGSGILDGSVVEFMAEMNIEAVERNWLKITVPKVLESLRSAVDEVEILSLFFTGIEIDESDPIENGVFISLQRLPVFAWFHLSLERMSPFEDRSIWPIASRFSMEKHPQLRLQPSKLEFLKLDGADRRAVNEIFGELKIREKFVRFFESIGTEIEDREKVRDAVIEKRSRVRSLLKK